RRQAKQTTAALRPQPSRRALDALERRGRVPQATRGGGVLPDLGSVFVQRAPLGVGVDAAPQLHLLALGQLARVQADDQPPAGGFAGVAAIWNRIRVVGHWGLALSVFTHGLPEG